MLGACNASLHEQDTATIIVLIYKDAVGLAPLIFIEV